MPEGTDKTCVLCGLSCAGQPRIKNQRGEYAHQACVDAGKAGGVSRKPTAAGASPGPALGSLDDDDLMGVLLDDLPQPAAAGDAGEGERAGLGGAIRSGCPGCGASLSTGAVVCVSCGFNTRTGKAGRTKVSKPEQPATGVAALATSAGSFAVAGSTFLIGALLGAFVGGAVGAAVWAGVVIATNYEVGFVAIGVGALCGFGAALGSRGQTGLMTGLIACVVTLAAISGGKYFASAHFANQFVAQAQTEGSLFTDMSDEEVADFFAVGDADDILAERLDAGGLDDATAERYTTLIEDGVYPDEYPEDVVADVSRSWDALSDTEREARMAEADASFRETQEMMRVAITDAGFFGSFTYHDIFFFGFALIAAYGVGSGGSTD